MPLPVGPVTRMIPWLWARRRSRTAAAAGARPSSGRSRRAAARSSSRSTTRSPKPVGTSETRTSMSRPATRSRMRPSCGRRRSAMSSPAMIFTRAARVACTRAGGARTPWRMPSMRNRTAVVRSKGSRWMSLAPAFTASKRSAFTSRMTGASSPASRRSRDPSEGACRGSAPSGSSRTTPSPAIASIASLADEAAAS